MTSKNTLIVTGVAIVVILLLTLVGRYNEQTGTGYAPLATPTPTPVLGIADKLPAEFKDGYMSTCVEDITYVQFCNCTYNYLDNKLTNHEFMDVAIKYSEDEIVPAVVDEAVFSCWDYTPE